MANFIELTSNKTERPALVNVDSIAWVSTKEVSGAPLAAVIHFVAAYAAEGLSLTVKEDYDAVVKQIAAV
ncbi:MAG: hypothetical protein M3O71_26710 [Bacteroidota bacterium]|nr:hypothetical protein [Bacteroidota bacterium]